jgi:hypothetical protein
MVVAVVQRMTSLRSIFVLFAHVLNRPTLVRSPHTRASLMETFVFVLPSSCQASEDDALTTYDDGADAVPPHDAWRVALFDDASLARALPVGECVRVRVIALLSFTRMHTPPPMRSVDAAVRRDRAHRRAQRLLPEVQRAISVRELSARARARVCVCVHA